MQNAPVQISKSEWDELSHLTEVIEGWGLDAQLPSNGDELSQIIYGVKFNFTSDLPGYTGELFILKGSGSPEDDPLLIFRTSNGSLKVVGAR